MWRYGLKLCSSHIKCKRIPAEFFYVLLVSFRIFFLQIIILKGSSAGSRGMLCLVNHLYMTAAMIMTKTTVAVAYRAVCGSTSSGEIVGGSVSTEVNLKGGGSVTAHWVSENMVQGAICKPSAHSVHLLHVTPMNLWSCFVQLTSTYLPLSQNGQQIEPEVKSGSSNSLSEHFFACSPSIANAKSGISMVIFLQAIILGLRDRKSVV